jgi:aryl-alcohol dehydrogenase-like predicted oxidoreductase
MKGNSSRRNFLAAGLALPAAGLGNPAEPNKPAAAGRLKSPPLRYRTLGKTGLKVTSVAFGCMITSDPSVIEKAADLGINHFDTARGYQHGNNERMVGAALKSRRKDITLSSKSHGETKEECLKDLDTSLQELGTDHLDIWYLHAKSKPEEVRAELMEAQTIAKKAGKIRFAGISIHPGNPGLIPAILRPKHFDVVLTMYNFTMDPAFDQSVRALKDAGIGVVAMKVMAGGNRRVKPDSKYFGILKRDGAMLAALKWVLKNKDVDTTIPSITDMDQLEENMQAMASSFTSDDEKTLAAHLERISPHYCRNCGGCAGTCPKGVPVADQLRYLMYAEDYGQFSLGRDNFRALPQDVAAIRCTDCDTCAVQCRNGVRVTERLIRAQELLA